MTCNVIKTCAFWYAITCLVPFPRASCTDTFSCFVNIAVLAKSRAVDSPESTYSKVNVLFRNSHVPFTRIDKFIPQVVTVIDGTCDEITRDAVPGMFGCQDATRKIKKTEVKKSCWRFATMGNSNPS